MLKIRKRYLFAAIIMFMLAAMFLGMNIYYSSSNVSVYMYHSVREIPVNEDDPELSIRPSEFEQQLKYFSKKRVHDIFASELKGQQSKHARYVVLTFDDGYEDNYTEVFPLLKKYRIKATIFMITGLIGKEGYLTAEQIKEMTDSGLVSVQSHTISHEPLALGDKVYEEVDAELGQSKAVLEEISGETVDCLSMPNGSFDDVVRDIARQYYDVIFTGDGFRVYSRENIDDIYRVGIYRRHTANDIRNMTENRALYLVKRAIQKLLGR